MSKYTEDEIARIIHDCEVLFVPEGASIEDVVQSSEPQESPKKSSLKTTLLNRYFESEEYDVAGDESFQDETEFEKYFFESKLKKNTLDVPASTKWTQVLGTQSDDTPDYAVNVNTELRNRLTIFRSKLEHLLHKINEKIRENKIFLDEAKDKKINSSSGQTLSYLRCGMPFFKDALGYPAPENEDYKYRKNTLKEFFPFDCNYSNTRWTSKDKVALISAVKKQMIDFIKIKQSQKISQESKTRGKIQKLRFISSNQDFEKMSVAEICETIEKDHPDFVIKWSLIAFSDLDSVHSVSECMGMWYSYLKPDINREPFSDEENAILSHVVVENKYQNWEEIAAHLHKRTRLQTFVHFFSSSSRLCPPNIRWTAEEDSKLLEAIKKHTINGVISWPKVGVALEGRNRTQCYNRYLIITRYTSEKKGVFLPNENRILLDYVAKYGPNFNKMPKELLPHRSIVQIKTHYNVALKHKGQINPWTLEEDEQLMKYVENEGPKWREFSEIIKTHNRLSCRTRHLTITKFLAKNPNKGIRDVPSRLKKVTAVHKAVEDEADMTEANIDEKVVRSKAFGLLTFEEFRVRNSNLYSVLRTTYNYDLSAKDVNIDRVKFLAIKHLFSISNTPAIRQKNSFTANQLEAIKNAISIHLDEKLFAEIKLVRENTQFLMPPNFNTAMGLRAIAIRKSDDPLFDGKKRSKAKTNTKKYKEQLEKFQKMFFSLFYWTAMTSRINSKELREIHLIRHPTTRAADIYQLLNRKSDIVKPQPKSSSAYMDSVKPPKRKKRKLA